MLAAVVYVVVFGLVRGLPGAAVAGLPRARAFPGRPPVLAWPAQGQAAVALEGVGLLGARGPRTPTPIASLAKVMSAYVVLRDHPLTPGAGGPGISVSARDVATFPADRATGQSVVAVRAGERLSERQALEGLLLPSGNNIATLLANWDAGSEAAFVAKMNAEARALGLAHTRYVDASGLNPGTVSTASDQVRLALAALRRSRPRSSPPASSTRESPCLPRSRSRGPPSDGASATPERGQRPRPLQAPSDPATT